MLSYLLLHTLPIYLFSTLSHLLLPRQKQRLRHLIITCFISLAALPRIERNCIHSVSWLYLAIMPSSTFAFVFARAVKASFRHSSPTRPSVLRGAAGTEDVDYIERNFFRAKDIEAILSLLEREARSLASHHLSAMPLAPRGSCFKWARLPFFRQVWHPARETVR
jgi:hypothetical protein